MNNRIIKYYVEKLIFYGVPNSGGGPWGDIWVVMYKSETTSEQEGLEELQRWREQFPANTFRLVRVTTEEVS